MTETQTPLQNPARAPLRVLDSIAVMKAIPHRFPFLLVDKVAILEEDKRAEGTKCVTINEPFFPGHFPGRPVMPGVLILEALAQTACVLMMSKAGLEGKLAFFMGIDGAKFRKPVEPGMVLKLQIEMLRTGSRAGRLRGEAYIEGQGLAAQAEMSFAIVDNKEKTA